MINDIPTMNTTPLTTPFTYYDTILCQSTIEIDLSHSLTLTDLKVEGVLTPDSAL